MTVSLHKLADWYETISLDNLSQLSDLYTDDCYFKDPFNETRSRADIDRIFRAMFDTLESPRFLIDEMIGDGNKAFLAWRFEFAWRGRQMTIQGGSHLRFAGDGRVEYHRDYWDVAEELYEKLPVLGWMMRRIRNMARA